MLIFLFFGVNYNSMIKWVSIISRELCGNIIYMVYVFVWDLFIFLMWWIKVFCIDGVNGVVFGINGGKC